MIEQKCIGFTIQRTIDKKHPFPGNGTTYRIRRGKQQKYPYSNAMAAVNTGLTVNKTKFASAVAYWQNTLTDGAKKEYHKRATKRLCMSGYNLFISEVMKGKFTI